MLPAEINKENKLCASIITQHHTLIKCKIFAATGKWIDWLCFEWLDCSAHLNQVQSAIFVILYGSQKYEMYKDHKSCILRDDDNYLCEKKACEEALLLISMIRWWGLVYDDKQIG